MSTVSSVSSSSSSSSSTSTTDIYNGHIFGLQSGLDVDSIVTGLVSDIQTDIDDENKDKQKLEWKETDYQNVVSALNTFKSAYLSVSGDDSLTNSDALQTFTASSSNSYIEATAADGCTGQSTDITVYQNAATASAVSSASSHVITSGDDLSGDSLGGLSFSLTVGSTTKTITLPSDTSVGGTTEDTGTLESDLQDAINSAFDWSDSDEEVKVNVTATENSDGTYSKTLELDEGTYSYTDSSGTAQTADYNVSYAVSSANSDSTGVTTLFGGADNNRLNRNDTLEEFLSDDDVNWSTDSSGDKTLSVNVNGTSVTLNGSDSLFTVISDLNSADTGVSFSYSSTTGEITATSTESGKSGNFSLLGDASSSDTSAVETQDNTYTLLSALGFKSSELGTASSTDSSGNTVYSPVETTNGQNAVYSFDDGETVMSSNSNSFTVDGVSYSIVGKISSSDAQEATVSFSQDTDAAVKNIQNFVSAYNTLLSTITTYTNTKPDSDYEPLTDTEKESMTDDEITEWNEKASAGVLFNDDTLNELATELREMVGASVTTSDGQTISLSDLGIRESTENTGTDDTTPGQLVFDDDSTDTLVSMLESNPNEVEELFDKESSISYSLNSTSTTTVNGVTESKQDARKDSEGIAYRLSDIVSDYTTTGAQSIEQGKLISTIGDSEDDDQNNSIYDQIEAVNTKISDYEDKMTAKKDALYNKFSLLESYMAQMNTQSSEISSLSSS